MSAEAVEVLDGWGGGGAALEAEEGDGDFVAEEPEAGGEGEAVGDGGEAVAVVGGAVDAAL